MKDILYHGSLEVVKNPTYGKGSPFNDYGRGFYCTKHIELAKEWAVRYTRDGYLNQYEINMDDLKLLNLLDPSYSILHWLTLLLNNRLFSLKSPIAKEGAKYLRDHYSLDLSPYDLILGYRADDSYFSFARDFLNNTISLEQLSYAMKLGELKEQYVLVSPKAFEKIAFQSFEPVKSIEYYPKRQMRDSKAREAYFKEQARLNLSGVFLRDLMNGGTSHE